MPVKVEFNRRQLIGKGEARRWASGRLSMLIKYQMNQIEPQVNAGLEMIIMKHDDVYVKLTYSLIKYSSKENSLSKMNCCRLFLPPWWPGQSPQPLDRLCQRSQEEEALLKISTPRTRERIRF